MNKNKEEPLPLSIDLDIDAMGDEVEFVVGTYIHTYFHYAIIFYNYFTNKIDAITYGIDEAGYSIVQTFTARN